jgi:hypothetical protein
MDAQTMKLIDGDVKAHTVSKLAPMLLLCVC